MVEWIDKIWHTGTPTVQSDQLDKLIVVDKKRSLICWSESKKEIMELIMMVALRQDGATVLWKLLISSSN